MGYGYARGAGSEEGLGYMELSQYPTPAPHIGHQNHLCEITSRGEATLEQVKAMVKDAKFICRKCGRAAANEENLCEPVSM